MKVIILGLDAINYTLLSKCKEEMPTLNRFTEEHANGILKTVFPYFTGPTWSSFQTGKTIANHGISNYYKFSKDMEPSFFTGSDLNEKSFYEYMDEAGLKCFIMNLPYTDPPRIKGDIIFSWIFAINDIKKTVYPASLIDKFPSIKNYKNYADRSGGVLKYLKNADDVLLSQLDVIRDVVSSKEYDVMFFLLEAPDMVQHKLFSDIISGKRDKKTAIGKKILKEVDGIVKWIDENKEEDAIVVILSDHGFKEYQGKFFINGFLKKEGYLETGEKGIAIKDTHKQETKKKTVDISKLVSFMKKNPLLLKIGEFFYDFIVKNLPFNVVKQPKIDMAKTVAYCRSGFDNIIFINDNLDNKEKENVKKEIIAKINAEDGLQAKDSDAYFDGKYRQKLGDIIVIGEEYEIDNTVVDAVYVKSKRPMHDMDGMWIIYGNNIKNKITVKNARLFDVIPTIFYSMGFEIPADMDGKAIKEIFSKEITITKKVKLKDDTEKEKKILTNAIRNIKL